VVTTTSATRPRAPLTGSLTRFVKPQGVSFLLVAVIVGYLALVPVGYLLWQTFTNNGHFTLSAFSEAYGDPQIGTIALNSVEFGFGSAALAIVIGTTLAYINVRTNAPLKSLCFISSLVPLIIPGILYSVSWILLASPRVGVINKALEPLFGQGTIDIFTMPGMVWVEGTHLVPIVFLLMSAAFRSMDPSLEEAAVMSGAGRLRTALTITTPLVRPALLACVLIMVARSFESFETPTLIGLQGNIYVFTSRIYFALSKYPLDYAEAGALALGLLVLVAIILFFGNRVGAGGGKRYATIGGKAFRPRQTDLGRWRWVAGALILLFFLLSIVLPVGVLLYASFLKYYQVPSSAAFHSMSGANYSAVLHQGGMLGALENTLWLGVAAATIVMVVMAVGAWIVLRSKVPGRSLIDHFSFLPLVVPSLVMGLALAFVWLRNPLPVYGSTLILLIAYCTRFMPYGMRYATTSMRQLSAELEESAHTSGATWFQTFWRVVLPLIRPGLLAGWLYIFIVSFRELGSSILLYSPGHEVLSVVLFEQYQNGQLTQLAALGVLMMLILVVVVVVAQRLAKRMGVHFE
jgi:iron(III) transport system permease protein